MKVTEQDNLDNDYPNIIGPIEMDLNDNVVFMFSVDCPTLAILA